MRQTLLLTAICSLPLIAVADEYSIEIDALASQSEVLNADNTASVDLDTTLVGVTFYTSPVDDSVGPFQEAAFLNKASSVSLVFGASESDDAGGDIYSVGFETKTVFSEKYILEFSYIRAERDEETATLNSDIGTYGLGFGAYTADNAAITFNYSIIDDDDDDDESEVAALGFEGVVEADGKDYLGGSIEAAYTSNGSGSDILNIDIEMDYYFNQKLSVSVLIGMETVSGDGEDANLFGVGTRYFLSNNLALALAYERLDIASSGDGEDTVNLDDPESITLSLTGRF
jgi:hypothetical protein